MGKVTDLELTKTDTNDYDKIVSQIEGYYKADSGTKNALSYKWELNHLMLDGQQWLTFEGNRETGGQWQRLQPSPQNEFIPRPVTNYLFDVYQTLKGYILKNKPRITVRPNTQTNKDKTAAKIAELVSNTNYMRLQEIENYEYAISCLITYGTVFKKDYWDTSYTSLVKVPKMEQRPVTDPATGLPTGQVDQVQSINPETGEYLFDELPLGDVNTAVVEPYRMAIDPLASNLHDARWVMEYSIRPLTWIVENFDRQEPGFTGLAKEVKPETNLSTSMRRFFQLKSSSGVKGILSSGLGSSVSSGESTMVDEAAVLKEYYERPTQQNSHGRLLVVANNKCIYAGPSPYQGPQQGDWHPYSACRWEIVPGRFWGKSPFDDSSEIQKHINSIDSVIILNRKTMAIPQKLIPRGTMAVNDSWTGRPGQKIFYTPGSNGERPETVPASDVGAQVMQEGAQKVEDIKSITGAIDILKGDRPPGVTAFSALNLLFEVGAGKLFPIADRWKRFIECSQRKQLQLVAAKFREPRPQFIQQLMSMNSELTTDQIKNFLGKDLYDNCNVVIDPSSAVPKMKAAEQAKLMELAQLGVLNLQDPANRAEFLDRLDILGFDGGYGKDANRAAYENDMLDQLAVNPSGKQPQVLDVDNDDIHLSIHGDREKEPSFLELPFAVQQAYAQHRMQHEQKKMQAEMQAQQQAAQQAMVTGQPAQPQQTPNPMDKQEPIRKGKGISTKTQNAINPDLTGGGIGTRG
ncbi:MAG: hypothetical protein NVS1B10_06750 [Candidatus Saccharimonadales bacterium]